MSGDFKGLVKSIVGPERVSAAKGQVMHRACSFALALQHKGKLQVVDGNARACEVFGDPGFHVFRGYYDLKYISGDGDRLLAHRLPLAAAKNRRGRAEIGYFDLTSKAYTKLTESSAWCWQQGSRLRWHPSIEDALLFNDVDEDAGDYCARVLDSRSGRELARYCAPLYDISPDGTWGLSLNYSRLQRLRPGYGYDFFPDGTKDDLIPDGDGLVLVNLIEKTKKVVFTLDELAEAGEVPGGRECYLNHLSIAPDGSKFMFFLIHKDPSAKGWGTALFLADRDCRQLRVLEREDRVSHYCWMGPDELMVTCRRDDGSEYYCVFDLRGGSKRILPLAGLDVDGHPGHLGGDVFVTDTYPLELSRQRLSRFSLDGTGVHPLAYLYHDYRMRGEMRCDLHPSIELGGSSIAVDTTFRGGRRSIAVLTLGDD